MGRKEQPSQPPIAPPTGIRRWMKPVSGGIFLIGGIGLLWPVSIRPLQAYAEAKTWRALPCTVVSRNVEGKTVRVRYQYEIGGTIYRNDRLRPEEYGDSVGGADPLLQAYQPGTSHTCYVSPTNPGAAVLLRNFGWNWLYVLLPLPLLVLGVIGVRSRWRNRVRRALYE